MVIKKELHNGIRLLYEVIPHTEILSLGFWQDIGSSYEDSDHNGYTHFIEHMLFKGADGLSAFEIARRIDSVGGVMNAFTTREHTCFYSNVVAKHLDLVIDLLSTMYYHASFDAEELAREQLVVLEEIKMHEDTPEEFLHDRFIKSVWPDHAIGFPIVGTVDNLIAMDSEKLRHFYRTNYGTDRLVIAAAGKMDPERLIARLEELPARRCQPGALTQHPVPRPRFSRDSQEKKLEQVHMILGMPGLSRRDERRYALYLFNLIFGGSMSSRLYQRIREMTGLCYSIYSFVSAFVEQGVFGIYCGTSSDHLQQVYDLMREEMDTIREQGIDQEELAAVKEQMKGNIILGRENIEARMNRLAIQELYYGQFYSLEEILERIDSVNVDDVQSVMDLVLDSRHCSLNTVGPREHLAIAGALAVGESPCLK